MYTCTCSQHIFYDSPNNFLGINLDWNYKYIVVDYFGYRKNPYSNFKIDNNHAEVCSSWSQSMLETYKYMNVACHSFYLIKRRPLNRVNMCFQIHKINPGIY